MEIVTAIIENGPAILKAAGELITGALMVVGAASTFAKLTPTKADDRFLDKVLQFLNGLALNPKKDKARD